MTTSLREPRGGVEWRPEVRIRPALGGDAGKLRSWRSEESVRRFQPLREVSTGQLRADLNGQHVDDLFRGRGDRFVWIIEAETEPCGWITLVVNNWEHGLAEIGYALSSPYQGHGIMRPALSQLLPDLLLRAPLARIEARCAVDNVASQAVLERLGFVREGRLRDYFLLHGERTDHWLYALLRSDYIPG